MLYTLAMKNVLRFATASMVFALVGCHAATYQNTERSVSVSSSSSSDSSADTTVYSNTAYGFEITFPTGWYLPKADDTDPHFFETEECANQDNPDCPAFEIMGTTQLSANDKKAFLDSANDSSTVSLPKRLYVIPKATVVETGLGEGVEGWSYEYHVLFEDDDTILLTIFSSDKGLEKTVFPTMHIRK